MPSPKIASFVYSCPRTPPTLPAALESIRAAGFSPVMVFEPDVRLEAYSGPGMQIAQATRHAGPYGLLKLGLGLTVQAADYVVAFQDDVICAKGMAEWLSRQIDLDVGFKSAGAISLYSAAALTDDVKTVGWHALPQDQLPRRAYGACVLCFPAESARLMLANPPEHCPVPRNRGMGLHADINVGIHCLNSGRPWLFHNPSLSQHVGAVSIAHPGAALSRFRVADQVVSDVAEIANWVPSKNAR